MAPRRRQTVALTIVAVEGALLLALFVLWRPPRAGGATPIPRPDAVTVSTTTTQAPVRQLAAAKTESATTAAATTTLAAEPVVADATVDTASASPDATDETTVPATEPEPGPAAEAAARP